MKRFGTHKYIALLLVATLSIILHMDRAIAWAPVMPYEHQMANSGIIDDVAIYYNQESSSFFCNPGNLDIVKDTGATYLDYKGENVLDGRWYYNSLRGDDANLNEDDVCMLCLGDDTFSMPKHYTVANELYPQLSICGENWGSYSFYNKSNNTFGYTASDLEKSESANFAIETDSNYSDAAGVYFTKVSNPVSYRAYLKEWRKTAPLEELNMDNRMYREYYYGGMEYTNYSCKDPISGGGQRYYMRGSNTQSVYACSRFINYPEAYKCCVKSSNSVCMSQGGDADNRTGNFCSIDNNCYLGGKYADITAEGDLVDESVRVTGYVYPRGNLLCIETDGLYPFDFRIGNGTTETKRFCDPTRCGGDCRGLDDSTEEERVECLAEREQAFNIDPFSGSISTTPAYMQIKNICTYNRHCVLVGDAEAEGRNTYTEVTRISPACLNFAADSRNMRKYDAQRIVKALGEGATSQVVDLPDVLGNYNGFTAPVVQCFKETLENIFMNQSSVTVCMPNDDGTIPAVDPETDQCDCGYYSAKNGYPLEYSEGMDCLNIQNDSERKACCLQREAEDSVTVVNVNAGDNYFARIQNIFRDVIILIVTLFIVISGFKNGITGALSFGGENLKSWHTVLKGLLKLSIVLYFALGSAWQDMFFEGVYKFADVASAEIVDTQQMVAKDIDGSESVASIYLPKNSRDQLWTIKNDGCQFDDITLREKFPADPNSKTYEIDLQLQKYRSGMEYLRLWDTLDCKIAKYLGFSTTGDLVSGFLIALGVSVILPGVGLFLFFMLMFFGFSIFTVAVMMAHIFIISSLSIVVLLYISPLIIPLSLFKQTESIFKQWLAFLVSFAIQPIIASIYVVIFILIMDKTLTGSAYYSGPADSRILTCNALALKDSVLCFITDEPYYKFSDGLCGEDRIGVCKYQLEDSTIPKVGNDIVLDDAQATLDLLEKRGIQVFSLRRSLNSNEVTPNFISEANELIGKLTGTKFIGSDVIPGSSFAPVGAGGLSDVVNRASLEMRLPFILQGGGFNKIIILLKSLLIIYVLRQIMSQIPTIAAKLTGGMGTGSSLMSATALSQKSRGHLSTIGKVATSPVKMLKGPGKKDGDRSIDKKPKEDTGSDDGSKGATADSITRKGGATESSSASDSVTRR